MSNDRTQHKEILNRHGIKLDPLEIHSKDFGVKLRGYSQEEVDDFLDEIIRDYEQMVKIIEELTAKQQEVDMSSTREVSRATRQFDVLAAKPPERTAAPAPTSAAERGVSRDEITMLKVRLANLERKVFGSSRSE